MKKTITLAAALLTASGLAAPAYADEDPNTGPGVNAANDWNFSAAEVCLQELAVVPTGQAWTGDPLNNCVNGNLLNQAH